jgi:N-acetylmuramoyl-L-alanine amidase
MREIKDIVIHCSYTFPDMDIGAAEIRKWHTDPKPKGNGWSDIGYHYVIRRDGTVEKGRPIAQPGAHVAGHNANTLAVCLVGGKARTGRQPNNFTRRQWRALDKLIAEIQLEFPWAGVKGHNDYETGKTCPTFDVKAWFNA